MTIQRATLEPRSNPNLEQTETDGRPECDTSERQLSGDLRNRGTAFGPLERCFCKKVIWPLEEMRLKIHRFGYNTPALFCPVSAEETPGSEPDTIEHLKPDLGYFVAAHRSWPLWPSLTALSSKVSY